MHSWLKQVANSNLAVESYPLFSPAEQRLLLMCYFCNNLDMADGFLLYSLHGNQET